MATTTHTLWLIGVRAHELNPSGAPNFIYQLQTRFPFIREGEIRQFCPVWSVTDPGELDVLQSQFGAAFAGFYFVDDAVFAAAKSIGIKLRPLELCGFPPDGADVCAVIPIHEMQEAEAEAFMPVGDMSAVEARL